MKREDKPSCYHLWPSARRISIPEAVPLCSLSIRQRTRNDWILVDVDKAYPTWSAMLRSRSTSRIFQTNMQCRSNSVLFLLRVSYRVPMFHQHPALFHAARNANDAKHFALFGMLCPYEYVVSGPSAYILEIYRPKRIKGLCVTVSYCMLVYRVVGFV